MAKRRKAINDQTKNENENLTMINAKNEDFVIHRRLMLTIAMKIDDRKKNENFIVADEADEANEKKVNETIVIDEVAKEINKTIIVDDEVVINEEDVAIAKSKYLTKIFSTTLMIIVFNS